MDVSVESVLRPVFFEEALSCIADDPTLVPIAGGTDLMVQLRAGSIRAKRLLDLSSALPKVISVTGGTLEIGAGTTMDTIANSSAVGKFCPGLSVAARLVGAWPIQCRATLGGNLANASPAADTAPPLMAANAIILTASTRGERRIPIRKWFTGPGRTVLKDRELIRAIEIPSPSQRSTSDFDKLGWRREQIISVASVGLQLSFATNGTVQKAAIALGSVAPTPVMAASASAFLEGSTLDSEAIKAAAAAVQKDISPIDDVRSPAWYRRHAVGVLLSRLLERAAHA